MWLRPSRALVILLLFSAVVPPPRVLTVLIAEATQQGTGEVKKTQQARGRNRIGSPARPDACCCPARIAGGDARRPASMRFLAHHDEPAILKILRRAAPIPILSADLRLRC